MVGNIQFRKGLAEKIYREHLTGSQWNVLLVIAQKVYEPNEAGVCANGKFVCLKSLSDICDLSYRQLWCVFRGLVNMGIIARTKERHGVRIWLNPYVFDIGVFEHRDEYDVFGGTKWALQTE